MKLASHQPPGEQQCLISNSNRIQEVQKHSGPTCLPCPEHRRSIPGENEGSGSLFVFFLSNAFDEVWKEGLFVKPLRNSVRRKMYKWIQHFLFARTARVKRYGILSKNNTPPPPPPKKRKKERKKQTSKSICLCEGAPQCGVLSPVRFLVYINDTLTTIAKRVSTLKHATCRQPGNLECI